MLGNYGNFNIGDEILLRAIIKDVQKRYGENILFQIPTRNPGFVNVYHKADSHLIEPLPIRAVSKILRAFGKSKVIIVGGGGIWSGYTGPLAHFIPIVTILGKLFYKRVEYQAIGLYSTAGILDRILVNIAVLLSDSCSVRDEESYKLLWERNRNKVKIVDDLAIQYLRQLSKVDMHGTEIPGYGKTSLALHKKGGKIIVGISVKPVKKAETNEKIVSEFSTAISDLNIKHPNKYHFVFFPFAKTSSAVESDEELTNGIRARLSKEDNDTITVLEHSDPLSWFVTIKEFVDIFIGMRFHSIIFASEARKPVLCIPYERKIIEFLKKRQSEADIATMPLEALGSFKIISFVDEFVEKITTFR